MEDLKLNLEDLGRLMRDAREAGKEGKKISREDIARYIGVSGKTVYEWETGNQHPGFLNVVKFCQYLGMTLDDLLGVKKNACLPC